MRHFSSYYQNNSGHQTFQGGDMVQGGLTHEYAYLNEVVLWGSRDKWNTYLNQQKIY